MNDHHSTLVSVILPVFNGAATLRRAIDSVLAQTHETLELIIVDDGSNDESLQIAESYGDNRVRVHRRAESSGGPATPRNVALSAARGELIALIDQDDYWLPEKLAHQVPHFADPEVIVVFSRAYVEEIDQDQLARLDYHERWNLVFPGPGPLSDQANALVESNPIPTVTAVFRKVVAPLQPFDPSLNGADEYSLWLQLSATFGRFVCVDRRLAVYSWHAANFSRRHKLARRQAQHTALARHLRRHPDLRRRGQAQLRALRRDISDLRIASLPNSQVPWRHRLMMLVQSLNGPPHLSQLRRLGETALSRLARSGEPTERPPGGPSMVAPETCLLCDGPLVASGHRSLSCIVDDVRFISECQRCGSQSAHPADVPDGLYEAIYRAGRSMPGYARYHEYAEEVLIDPDPLHYLARHEDMYWALAETVRTRSPALAVDVGSGLGYTTFALNRAGIPAVGLDISAQAVGAARSRFGDFFRVVDQGEFPEDLLGSVDLLLMLEMIEHVSDPRRLLSQVRPLLSEEGSILVTTPNRSLYRKRTAWATELPPIHLHWMTESGVRELAGSCGYSVELLDFSAYAGRTVYPPWLPDEEFYRPTFDEHLQLIERARPNVPEVRPGTSVPTRLRRRMATSLRRGSNPYGKRATTIAALLHPLAGIS